MGSVIKKISIVGGGQWGTALANTIACNLDKITIIAREPNIVNSINSHSENTPVFPGIKLAANIKASYNIEDVLESDVVILAIPSQALREVVSQIHKLKANCRFVIISKGIENSTMHLMHQIVSDISPKSEVAALSGPNFAKYIIQKLPAASVIASHSDSYLADLSDTFNTSSFRCYTSNDLAGIEVCGAVKNVLAIASGICEGYGLGENAKAALITRSLVEMERIVSVFGGNKETVYGLAGVGDIMLTCGTNTSRNYKFGYQIGKTGNVMEALAFVNSTVEGYTTTKSVHEVISVHNLDMPICSATHKILYEGVSIEDALKALMSRPII